MSAGEYDEYGVEECKQVLGALTMHSHIEDCGMDFDRRLAHRYMRDLKDAVGAGIFMGYCNSWFRDSEDRQLSLIDRSVVEISKVNEDSLFETMFQISLSDGSEGSYRLHEQSVYSSFYADKRIYSIAKPPACAILDFVLSKGGSEAIAESFYSTMRAQQQIGGQSNEVLAMRTKISWCLPSLKNSKKIIQDAAKTYIEGDTKIKPHKVGRLFSGRGKSYSVSKVLDRVNDEKGRCSFLI